MAALGAAVLLVAVGFLVQHFRLDNGLSVVLGPSRLAPVVAVQAWVAVGSADERSHLGIAHVFEHMLFKGTKRRGVGEIARAVEAAGGDINAWTSFDQTVYHVVVGSRHLDTGLDVLSDALAASSFEPAELEREREVILEEIRQGNDDPSRAMAQGLFSTTFVHHPYRRPVIGTPQSVRSIRRPHLLEFFRRWYVANNMTLVVTGDFDEDQARRRIQAHFGGLRPSQLQRRVRPEPRQHEARAAVAQRDVSEAHLGLAFRIPTIAADDTAALDVAAIALGQGESSRLSSEVLRKRELVTGAYAYVHCMRDAGMFVVGATCEPQKLSRAAEAVLSEVYRVAASGVSQAELAKAKQAIEVDAVTMRETVEGMARAYGTYQSLTGDPGYERRYLDRVAAVTEADVRRAAERFLRPSATNISAVLPRGRRPAVSSPALLAMIERSAARALRGQTAPRRAESKDLVRRELPSGLRVIVKRDPSVPLVAARVVWTGGLLLETPQTSGVTQLLASSITRGCGDLSAEDVIQWTDDTGSTLFGVAGRNSLGLRAEWLARNWERGLEILADCVLRPKFEREEVDRERRRMLEDLAARDDNPSSVVFRLFAETLFTKHPYRLDMLGSEESLHDLSARRLARFYRDNYPAARLTLAVVGDVEPERVVRAVENAFSGIDVRKKSRTRSKVAEVFSGRPASAREVYRYMDREQAQLVIGFPGSTLDDPDRYAVEVMTTVLGGQGGRLFVELRDKQALAYRVGAHAMDGLDPGYVAVYLSCSPDKLSSAVAAIRRELSRIADDGVTAQEVERAAKYLVGTHDISLQRRATVASALAFHEAYGLGYRSWERYDDEIAKITPRDVQRIAKRIFDWDTAVIATVMPSKQTPEVVRRAKGRVRRAPARKPARAGAKPKKKPARKR